MLVSVCLMSTYIFFFVFIPVFFLSGLGSETYVALLLINIHFLKICVLTGIFFFLNCMARIEGLSNWARQTESLRFRVLICSSWPSS